MALFQLDPQNIAARVRTANPGAPLPSLAVSVRRGILGFTLVSVAGFLPWPIIDRWFHDLREMHLYAACTAVFIGLSGVCLHRLILGDGSLSRFYKLFALAFGAYVVGWVVPWVILRDDSGVIAGLLAGTALMGAILCLAFDAARVMPQVIAALFALNGLGYYVGGEALGKLGHDHRIAGIVLWGMCFGIGLGAGLGVAFHLCQTRARALLRSG